MTDALDPDALDPEVLRGAPLVAALEQHAAIGSTNDHARGLAAESGPLPLLIVADRQTAGRGRGANRWWADGGALTFSLLLDPTQHGLPPERLGLLSLTTAVAIADAALATVGAACEIKWPNDVYLGGKKIAGVLIESPRPDRLIVGVGINVSVRFDTAPDDVRERATSLSEHASAAPSRQAVLEAFLQAYAARIEQLAAGDPAPLEAARAACLLTGRNVTLEHGSRRTTGYCRGVADDGGLRLVVNGSVVTHHAGTIEAFD